MVKLHWANGQNALSNEVGVQINGSKTPNLQGFSPRELLEASVALCVSITLESILERDQSTADKNEIQVDVTASKAEGIKNRFTDFDVVVTFPHTLDENYKKKLEKSIERGCTVSNTLKGDVSVRLQGK